MTDQFSGPYLPHSHFSICSSRAHKLPIISQRYSSYSIFVGIVYLPERRGPFNFERPDSPVRPTWNYYFICEEGTVGVDTCIKDLTTAEDWVIISVPQTNCSIFRTCWEFIWDSRHVEGIKNWFSVVFTKKHLGEVTCPHSIDETFIWCC